jgi:hypothetical protein
VPLAIGRELLDGTLGRHRDDRHFCGYDPAFIVFLRLAFLIVVLVARSPSKKESSDDPDYLASPSSSARSVSASRMIISAGQFMVFFDVKDKG